MVCQRQFSDAPVCLVSAKKMLARRFWTVLGKECAQLTAPEEETVGITLHGTLSYLTPALAPYNADGMIEREHVLDECTQHQEVDLNCLDVTPSNDSTDPIKQLKTLIMAIQPSAHYHTDTRQLDEAS